MKYAKLKSNGRMMASEAWGSTADELNVFVSGVGVPANELDFGYEADAVVEGWWAAQNEADLTYSDKRKAKYNLLNQDEMRYDDVKNSTTTWVDAIDAIKAEFPKP